MPNNYPPWAAGDPITADWLNLTQGDVIVKLAATSRTTTTTLADDPDLTTTLDANATYFVEFFLHMVSPTGVLIKTAWTVPSGATGNKHVIGVGSAATDGNSDNIAARSGVHGFTTSVTYGTRGANTNQIGAVESAIVTTTSAGTLAMQWAQVTSSATAAQMSAGSGARVKRIA